MSPFVSIFSWLHLVVLHILIGPTHSTKPPHIVFVLIDDWGWGNWGKHRDEKFAETVTPNMDKLVANGVLLDQFYTHQYCAPSRCSLQTGRLPIHANVVNAGLQTANVADPIAGMSGIPRDMTGIATKLKTAGYATHMVGKWDAGMATTAHIPRGRGYDSSLVYFGHKNNYWTMLGEKCGNESGIVDLWSDVAPAYTMNNSASCSQSNQSNTCIYEDDLFTNTVLNIIEQHDPELQPLFLMWAPHLVHAPLEVPQTALDLFAFIEDDTRRKYAAMVYYVDTLIGRVVAALHAKDMWNDLIWMSASDNGGPVYPGAGGNNHPLRGGKHSNWEGGVRVNAYISGGYLPSSVHGRVAYGLSAICDVYTTFCGIAGVDPTDELAAASGLPPVDGVNLWPWVIGEVATSPRREVPLGATNAEVGHRPSKGGNNSKDQNDTGGNNSNDQKDSGTIVQGLIQADGWKLLIGNVSQSFWQGPIYPNSTSEQKNNTKSQHVDCGVPSSDGPHGCLFNLWNDPNEHENVADLYPDIVLALYQRIKSIQMTVFSPNRGVDQPQACETAIHTWKGYWGPFL